MPALPARHVDNAGERVAGHGRTDGIRKSLDRRHVFPNFGFVIFDGHERTAAAAATIHRREERAGFAQGRDDVARFGAAMLAKKAAESAHDGLAIFRARGFDSEVAFGVEAHRAVAEIGGTDPQQHVVNDRQFGMNHDAGGIVTRADRGRQHAYAVLDAGAAEHVHKTETADQHGAVLKPFAMGLRDDQQRFELGLFAQPAGELPRDFGAGQKLVFDIDPALGTRQHVGEERLDLARAVFALVWRLGARDADGDIGEVRFDAFGPAIAGGRRRLQLFVRGPAPAAAHQIAERGGRRTIDHHLDVVKRPVRLLLRIDAVGIVRCVVGRVPAADGEIETAAKGQAVVDDDELLMMGPAERYLVVETEIDITRRHPAELHGRQQLTLLGVENRIIPEQQLD